MLHNGYLRLSCLIIILFMVLPCSLFVYRSEERRSVFRGDIRDEDFETANPSNLVHGSGDYGEFREGPGYRMSIDSMGASHLELTVIPGNVSKNDVTADGKVYTRVCIPGSSLTGNVGRPELPALLLTLAVPTQDIDIDVIASESHRIRTNDIYPLQPPLIDSGIGIPERFTVDSVWYDSPEPYPEGMVEISQNGKLRDVDFVRLNVNPVSVSPGFRGIEVLDSITLRLSWKAGTGATRSGGTCTPVEPAFEPLYRSIFSDWTEYKDLFVNGDERRGAVKDPTDLPADAEGAEYLIIADPGLESAAVPLRQWKTERGIITTIVNTTETGNTAEDIRLYLEDAYDNWTVRPSYVLLLGDADHIPTNYEYTHPYHGTLTGSDHWYTTLSGADYYSDIHIGRMPVDDLAQAELLVGKAINYEKNPPTEDHYYTNASMAGYFQDGAPYSGTKDGYEDRRFILTSEEIRDYLMSIGKNVERIYCAEGGATPTHYNDGSYANGEALPAELLRANGFGWDDGTAEVTNSVNDGVFILNHRDHGARWGWGDPHFDTGDINALSNGDLQPVVYSINCQTGWFDHETDGDAGTTTESFCEVFVRKENGGAANCIGATRVSYSGHNDYMARGFYDAVFPDFDAGVGTSTAFYHIGEIMDYGKSYMAATWGDPWGIEQLEFELFHVFGDPHMELWTSKPTALSVSHPEMIDENATSVRVNVSEDGAFVSLESGGEIIGRGSVSGGFADVILAAAPSKNITVTVTKHDRLPYQAELLVFFDNSSDTGTTGDAFQFIIGGLDDIDVDSVYINWSHGGLLGNVSLSEDSGNWSGPAVLDHSLQLLNYTVLVNDTHNNWNVSDERSANVTDNDEPTLDSDDSPDTGTTGDNYVFDVTISDNIDVDKAYTNWTHGALSGNDSMTDDGDGTWSLTIVLANDLGDMTYYIWFNDTSDNIVKGAEQTASVSDNDDPIMDSDNSPNSGTTGDNFVYDVTISDNIDVDEVYMNWTHGALSGNDTMTDDGDGTWSLAIVLDDDLGDLTYYVWFNDTSDNIVKGAEQTVSVSDNDDPTLDSDDSPDSGNAGAAFTFDVSASDNVEVGSVNVSWSHDSQGGNEALTDDGDGTWSLTINLDLSISDMTYSVQVNDSSDNVLRQTLQTVTVLDAVDPTLDSDDSPDAGTTGDAFTFDVTVSDDVEVDGVNVTWAHGALSGNEPLSNDGDGTWSLTITLDDSLVALAYSVQVNDTSGNHFRQPIQSITVTDNDDPTLQSDDSPDAGTTGDAFTFDLSVADNIDVQSVNVTWAHGALSGNEPLSNDGDGTWSLTISLDDSISDLSYSVQVNDTSGNHYRQTVQTVSVSDNDDPVITSDDSPDTGTTGDSYTFDVAVSDNVAVNSVNVTWAHGRTGGNEPLSNDGDGTWSLTITLGHTLAGLLYSVQVNDTSGNYHRQAVQTVSVSDNDDPQLQRDNSPNAGTTGDNFAFDVALRDNIGIGSVNVTWKHDRTGGNMALRDDGDGTWSLTITLAHSLGDLYYSIQVNDTSGNFIRQAVQTITVSDNDAPAIAVDTSPGAGTTGDIYNFDVSVTDNIAVLNANVSWTHGSLGGNMPLGDDGDGTWSFNITLDHIISDLLYSVQVNDTSGNVFRQQTRSITVLDNDLPALLDHSPPNGTTGDSFSFNVTATDNIGIGSANVSWSHGELADNVPMLDMGNGTWGLIIMLDHWLWNLTYTVQVNDTSGNFVRWTNDTVTVSDNDLPLLMSDQSQDAGTTGDPFRFNVTVSDNIDIEEVKVSWMHGHLGGNDTAEDMGGGTWSLEIVLGHLVEDMEYLLFVNDTSGNLLRTGMNSVGIADDDGPGFTDNNRLNGTTGDAFFFNISAFDNIAVEAAYVRWVHGDIGSNLTLTASGDLRTGSIILDHSTAPIVYSYYLVDTSGNTLTGQDVVRNVTDNDLPVAYLEGNITVEQREEFTVSGNGSYDNMGIANRTWSLPVNGGAVHYGDNFKHTFSEPGTFEVVLTVRDEAGNEDSKSIFVKVMDSDRPEAYAGSDAAIAVHTWYVFDGSGSTDNTGITNYSWSFLYNGIGWNLYGANPRFFFVTPGNYNVTLTVLDSRGNSHSDNMSLRVTVDDTGDDDEDDDTGEDDDDTAGDDDDVGDDDDTSDDDVTGDDDDSSGEGDGDGGEGVGKFFSSPAGISIIGVIGILLVLGILLMVRRKSRKEEAARAAAARKGGKKDSSRERRRAAMERRRKKAASFGGPAAGPVVRGSSAKRRREAAKRKREAARKRRRELARKKWAAVGGPDIWLEDDDGWGDDEADVGWAEDGKVKEDEGWADEDEYEPEGGYSDGERYARDYDRDDGWDDDSGGNDEWDEDEYEDDEYEDDYEYEDEADEWEDDEDDDGDYWD